MIPCDRCPKHPWAVIFENETAGDLICTECGLVVGDRLIYRHEQRMENGQTIKERSEQGRPRSEPASQRRQPEDQHCAAYKPTQYYYYHYYYY